MQAKNKIVELFGQRYQVRYLPPDVGSFIIMRLISSIVNASSGQPSGDGGQATEQEASFEDRARMLVLGAMLNTSDFEAHKQRQQQCLAVCSRMEMRDTGELPMPITDGGGRWAIPEIRDNVALVMKLETEVLVFNVAYFLENGGLGGISGVQAVQQ